MKRDTLPEALKKDCKIKYHTAEELNIRTCKGTFKWENVQQMSNGQISWGANVQL